jgi:hypothetical protein
MFRRQGLVLVRLRRIANPKEAVRTSRAASTTWACAAFARGAFLAVHRRTRPLKRVASTARCCRTSNSRRSQYLRHVSLPEADVWRPAATVICHLLMQLKRIQPPVRGRGKRGRNVLCVQPKAISLLQMHKTKRSKKVQLHAACQCRKCPLCLGQFPMRQADSLQRNAAFFCLSFARLSLAWLFALGRVLT